MSKWFLSLVLLYSSTLFVVTSGQCATSCVPCIDSANCARCPLICWGCFCINQRVYFSNSKRICGNDCALCCAGSPYSRGQCMRTANGVQLDSAARCWTVYESLQDPSSYSAPTTRSWSGTQSYSPQSHTRNQDSNDEEINHGAVWRGVAIGVVALIILVVVLTRYSPCLKTRIISRESEEQPISGQTPTAGVPVSDQNANQGEVVVVVAPDGEVDVGLKDKL